MKKLRVSVVSYLNSLPFAYGLRHPDFNEQFALSTDTPFECAKKLISDEADVGLIPAAAIKDLGNYQIVSDYCIGCDGAVESVVLFSNVPLNQIASVYLDYQSRTSVQLLKILARQHWNIHPLWLKTRQGYESKIKHNKAGLIIGDRALAHQGTFPFAFDLGQAWKEFTGMPFVFACWVANKPLGKDALTRFERAIEFGLDHKSEIIATYRKTHHADISGYLTHSISYRFDEQKQRALDAFLQMMRISRDALS